MESRRESDQIAQRKRKLAELRALGVDPYPHRYTPTDTAAALQREGAGLDHAALEALGRRARVAGRIVALRSFGKAVFATLLDASGRIQVFLQGRARPRDVRGHRGLDIGDIVGVEGVLFRTRTNELTVPGGRGDAADQEPAAAAGEVARALRRRGALPPALPRPDRQPRGARGLPQRAAIIARHPRVLRRARLPRGRDADDAGDPRRRRRPALRHVPQRAGLEMFLRVAPELYLKRLVVGGFERVFEINRNFRNEGLSHSHNPEFTMLEFYAAYIDYHVADGPDRGAGRRAGPQGQGHHASSVPGQPIDLTPPWPRLRLVDSLWEVGGLTASRRATPPS